MNESTIQKQIMLALSDEDCTVWRNNTARAWVGNTIHRGPGTYQLGPNDVLIRDARPLHAGLCTGSSDLIGVQHGTGKFVAVEVKANRGRVSDDQKNFIDHILSAGGLAGVARSPEDALDIIKKHRNS